MADRETALYGEPSIARPTIQQLMNVAQKLHLHVEAEQLEQYRGRISSLLKIYDRIDKLPEPSPHFEYPTTTGFQPTAEQNPYNAWARIIDLAGAKTGKLTGRTVAIKDNLHIAGVPMTNGSNFMRGFVSQYTASVVTRILDEGGFIKGKSTCENLCLSGASFTSSIGPVLNPYDKRYSSGGSSSGSAVLVAIGEVDMAVGNDMGGSIRVPASWCGIVGLKPTYGLVPYTGILSLDCPIDHCGSMARTVRDCALLLEVMAGPDGLDPRQPTALSQISYVSQLSARGDLVGLRIGLLREGFEDCEADVENSVRQAAKSLTQLGALVDEFSSSLHQQAQDIADLLAIQGLHYTYTFGGLTPLNMKGFKDTATHDFMFKAMKSSADNLSTKFKASILGSTYVQEYYGCHFYAKALNVLRDIVAGYDLLFQKYDVIIMPTVKFKALPLPKVDVSFDGTYYPVVLSMLMTFDADYMQQASGNMDNVAPFNATGHPALSINVGFSADEPHLPIGMMIVGRHFDDVTVLQVAHNYERLRDLSPDYKIMADKLSSKFQALNA